MFIHNRNEPYLPLPSQPQLVLIYQPRRDGRLSRPWCKVAQAEIRTRNLPIANPALYHHSLAHFLHLVAFYDIWPGNGATYVQMGTLNPTQSLTHSYNPGAHMWQLFLRHHSSYLRVSPSLSLISTMYALNSASQGQKTFRLLLKSAYISFRV